MGCGSYQTSQERGGIMAQNWTFGADFTGYKTATLSLSGGVTNTETVVRYDGKILKPVNGSFTAGDQSTLNGSTNVLTVSITDTDSGWTETLNPNNNAVTAWFNGWKANGNNGTVYNSWVSVVDGSSPPTNTEAYVAANPAFRYNNYKLTYQLAQSTFDDLSSIMEGEINLLEGNNQIEVGAGVIVREKATPKSDTTRYFIEVDGNKYANGKSELQYRNNRILDVYKNGRLDPKWSISTDPSAYGTYIAATSVANYDPTATYETTYQALDQYLITPSAVTTITAEYDTNIKTVQDRQSQRLADYGQRLSVAEMLASRVYGKVDKSLKDTTYYVDGTNGSDSGDGSASKPFKTIGKAISMIPQILNHNFTINVAAGTYSEDILISGFYGQNAVVSLLGDTVVSTSVSINSLTISNCVNAVIVRGLNVTGFASSNNSIAVVRTGYTQFSLMNVAANDTARNGFYVVNGHAYILNSTISNKNTAIWADNGSRVTTNNNAGTGNVIVNQAGLASIITKASTQQPSGTTIDSQNGGIITSGVLNPWGDNNSAISKATNGYQKLPSGLIIQWGAANATSAGVALTFPIAFPTACQSITLTALSPTSITMTTATPSTTGATIYSSSNTTYYWIAIGY